METATAAAQPPTTSRRASNSHETKKTPTRAPVGPPPEPMRPVLRLTPAAWAKLMFLRDVGTTEIGGFGISVPGDLLLVEDVRLVRQSCDWASVMFDDGAVADFFDGQVDAGRRPAEFGRIWVHTHPGDSARPSVTDEMTFARVFGACDWAVMLIVARGGSTYARLQFGVGPGGALEIPVEVDYSVEFTASDWPLWQAEYAAGVFEAGVADAGQFAYGDFEAPLAGGLFDESLEENWEEYNRWLGNPRLWEFPSTLT